MHPRSYDTMIIVSVSGRNAAGVDMALAAKAMGCLLYTSMDAFLMMLTITGGAVNNIL